MSWIALLVGVVTFGGFALALRRALRTPLPPLDPEWREKAVRNPAPLSRAWVALFLIQFVAMLLACVAALLHLRPLVVTVFCVIFMLAFALRRLPPVRGIARATERDRPSPGTKESA